jgi:hypothetical protein
MRAHFQREPQAEWTTYNASLARPLLNSKAFLEKINAGSASTQDVQSDIPPGATEPEPAVTENSRAATAKEK